MATPNILLPIAGHHTHADERVVRGGSDPTKRRRWCANHYPGYHANRQQCGQLQLTSFAHNHIIDPAALCRAHRRVPVPLAKLPDRAYFTQIAAWGYTLSDVEQLVTTDPSATGDAGPGEGDGQEPWQDR